MADGSACAIVVMKTSLVSFTALGFHLGILGDRDIADTSLIVDARIAAADAGTGFASGGGDFRAAADGDITAASTIAAADAGTMFSAGGNDFRVAADSDITAVAIKTTANAGSICSAVGGYFRVAGDGDVAAVAPRAAADAGSKLTALGGDFRVAADGNITAAAVAAVAPRAAADAGTFFAAGDIQAAGKSGFVGDGEIAFTVTAILGGVLLYTGTLTAALDGVFPVQLQGHIAVARDLDSCYTQEIINLRFAAGSAHIDVHAVQGDIGGSVVRHIDGDRRLIAAVIGEGIITDDNVHFLQSDIGNGTSRCRNGDGVGGGRFTVGLGDDGGRGLLFIRDAIFLGDILPAIVGCDGDTASGKVIFLRKGGKGQAADEQQGQKGGYKTFGFHGAVSFRWAGMNRVGGVAGISLGLYAIFLPLLYQKRTVNTRGFLE